MLITVAISFELEAESIAVFPALTSVETLSFELAASGELVARRYYSAMSRDSYPLGIVKESTSVTVYTCFLDFSIFNAVGRVS